MEVTFTSSLEAGQRQELLALFETSFGKALRNDSMLTSMEAVCMVTHPDQGLCGAALLEKTACGIYLSKFAVAPAMRGDGIAKLMWEHLCASYPAFFGVRTGRIHFPLGICVAQRIGASKGSGASFGMG